MFVPVRRAALTALLAVTGLVLVGCANHEEPAPPGAGMSVSYGMPPSSSATLASQEHNQADVTFVDQAVLLRQQAAAIAGLAGSNGQGTSLRAFATKVIQSGSPNVTDLAQTLAQWGQPMPTTASAGNVPGLLTDAQLAELRDRTGSDFDDLFKHDMSQNLDASLRACDTELLNGMNQHTKQIATDWSASLHGEQLNLSELPGQS